MVNIARIPRKPAPEYVPSPYDLVDLVVEGVAVQARPYRFDSEPVGGGFLNDFGVPIRPTHVVAACPRCTAGLELELAASPEHSCQHCGAPALADEAPPLEPFRNPFLHAEEEAGSLDVDLLSVLGGDQEGTVADRMAIEE